MLVNQLHPSERKKDFLLQQLMLECMLPYFFVGGHHHHYARCITRDILEMYRLTPHAANTELISGPFVCGHQKGYWNSVNSDQFGEQTAIQIGKGDLRGMKLSPERVADWIDSHPITAYISYTMEHIYPNFSVKECKYQAGASYTCSGLHHKEQRNEKKQIDADNQHQIFLELLKVSHPFQYKSLHLNNIANGQICPPDAEVIVAKSVDIGTKIAAGFHAPISSPIKTMKHIEKGLQVGDKMIFDLQTIFLTLLTLGQQRHMKLAPIFQYELCPLPPSLIDQYGCLRKGSKAALAHKLCVKTSQPMLPEVTIVDMSQLLFHIVWPSEGDVSAIVKSIKTRLSSLPGKKILVFDKYNSVSAKDHERMRRTDLNSIDYNLTINTQLPSRDAIMRNKHNKMQLLNMLSTYTFGKGVTVESCSNGVFHHDEADITMISYLLMAAESGTQVIRILSDDTDVFVMLVYWVYQNKIQATVQMERWDGVVWDMNATCAQLDSKCLQILGMHYLTGSDATSYLYRKGKVSALKTLQAGDFPGLYSVLGELNATPAQLMDTGESFICALYGQPQGTPMSEARYNMYTKKCGMPLKVTSLPPTQQNLFLHILRAHLQTILAKAANQVAPPKLHITKYGWEIKDNIPVPSISDRPPGPKDLMDMVKCIERLQWTNAPRNITVSPQQDLMHCVLQLCF